MIGNVVPKPSASGDEVQILSQEMQRLHEDDASFLPSMKTPTGIHAVLHHLHGTPGNAETLGGLGSLDELTLSHYQGLMVDAAANKGIDLKNLHKQISTSSAREVTK